MTDQLKPCPLCGGAAESCRGIHGTEHCASCMDDTCEMSETMLSRSAWGLLPRVSEDAEPARPGGGIGEIQDGLAKKRRDKDPHRKIKHLEKKLKAAQGLTEKELDTLRHASNGLVNSGDIRYITVINELRAIVERLRG